MPAPIDRRDAIERRAVVHPARQPIGAEPTVTRGRADEDDVLLGHPDQIAGDVGEEAGQPGSGGEDELIGCMAAAVRA